MQKYAVVFTRVETRVVLANNMDEAEAIALEIDVPVGKVHEDTIDISVVDAFDDDVPLNQGPRCGHSHCSQNYIDTGETECVPLEGIESIGGSYAGFTDIEWRAYAEGRYQMRVPPVTTVLWSDESWMAWIFGPRPAGPQVPRNVCHVCLKPWDECGGTCALVNEYLKVAMNKLGGK